MSPSTKTTSHDRALLRAFHAIGEETRLGVVRLLAGGERCVCELQTDLGAAQSRLSFHLRKLKDAGVVSDRKVGRWVYYSLAPEVLEELRAFLEDVTPREGWEAVGDGGRGEKDCCE